MSDAYRRGLEAGRTQGIRIGIAFRVCENPYSITHKAHYEWENGFTDGWWGK